MGLFGLVKHGNDDGGEFSHLLGVFTSLAKIDELLATHPSFSRTEAEPIDLTYEQHRPNTQSWHVPFHSERRGMRVWSITPAWNHPIQPSVYNVEAHEVESFTIQLVQTDTLYEGV